MNKKAFWINFFIFIILLFIFWPLALIFAAYKYNKSKKKTSKNRIFISPQNNSLVSINKDIEKPLFAIPEPTKSLLWVTDEDTSKIVGSHQFVIQMTISADKKVTTETKDNSYSFFSEPSLIWTKLPIKENTLLETQKMYWPQYSQFTPEERYQYLKWLEDITQPTNLSYVFLYYYGLERQLLLGDFDSAVEEILRLIQFHERGTLKSYVSTSLAIASGKRKRPDVIDKASFILDASNAISLYLLRISNKSLSAQTILDVASQIGFSNKLYIKRFPQKFKGNLEVNLAAYQLKYGDILQTLDIASAPMSDHFSMLNSSIPENIRQANFPNILESPEFKSVLMILLKKTHEEIKVQSKQNLI